MDENDIKEVEELHFDDDGTSYIRGTTSSADGRIQYYAGGSSSYNHRFYVDNDEKLRIQPSKVRIYEDLDMSGNPISNLATPSEDSDAATKEYVDGNIETWRDYCYDYEDGESECTVSCGDQGRSLAVWGGDVFPDPGTWVFCAQSTEKMDLGVGNKDHTYTTDSSGACVAVVCFGTK